MKDLKIKMLDNELSGDFTIEEIQQFESELLDESNHPKEQHQMKTNIHKIKSLPDHSCLGIVSRVEVVSFHSGCFYMNGLNQGKIQKWKQHDSNSLSFWLGDNNRQVELVIPGTDKVAKWVAELIKMLGEKQNT